MKKCYIVLTLTLLLLLPALSLSGTTQTGESLKPVYADIAPVIDGSLDDEIWNRKPAITENFISYWPHYGEKLPYKTEVWMAYDEHNLYFALYAHDPEPDKIKTSITKRDNIVPEDWVGILLNTSGNRQNAYGFYSNPSGIQYDEIQTASTEDSAPDWVWYNAARRVTDGYIVEFHIQLKNIIYTSGENVKMCVIFFRKVSRLGYVASWPVINAGSNALRSSADVEYGLLKSAMKIEVLPSITYSNSWRRETPDKWVNGEGKFDFGVDLNVGITSSISTDITYNPDFSQVESDTFQVLVNRKYPVFYSEKRPFFMELSNIYDVARGFLSNMSTAVHTRRIVNPSWGAKVRAELGNLYLGFLAAEDELLVNGEADDTPAFMIGRLKYSLGGDNYIGMLVTNRDFSEGNNTVFGFDVAFNPVENMNIKAHWLHSETEEQGEKTDGDAFHLNYYYNSRPFQCDVYYEKFDKDFRMDTAFYERTGFEKVTAFVAHHIYTSGETSSWLKDISPRLYLWKMTEEESDLDELMLEYGVRFQFARQGALYFLIRDIDEIWLNSIFERTIYQSGGGIQATNWLSLQYDLEFGDQLLYDFDNPFVGDGFSLSCSTTLNISENLSQFISYNYQELYESGTDEKVFDVSVINSRTTYQFNRYLFVRASLRYDSYRDVLLSDFLASFTLIPGTVIHLGYGSLHENLHWESDNWQRQHSLGEMYQTNQSVFFKASYRWQN